MIRSCLVPLLLIGAAVAVVTWLGVMFFEANPGLTPEQSDDRWKREGLCIEEAEASGMSGQRWLDYVDRCMDAAGY